LSPGSPRDDGAKERVTTFFDTSFSRFGTAPEGMFEQFLPCERPSSLTYYCEVGTDAVAGTCI
jgi:hypothetical protein